MFYTCIFRNYLKGRECRAIEKTMITNASEKIQPIRSFAERTGRIVLEALVLSLAGAYHRPLCGVSMANNSQRI